MGLAVVSGEHCLNVNLFLEVLDGEFILKVSGSEGVFELVSVELGDVDVSTAARDELVDALGRPEIQVHNSIQGLESMDLADGEVIEGNDLKINEDL